MPPRPSAKPPAKPSTKSGQTHQKATPKQPLPIADRLKRLFTSLCAQIDGGHFANAIKTCDKILRLDPKDQDALQTKLFLLLQTDQYAAALALTESPSSGDDSHAFEKTYSLYRLHREDEAIKVLEVIKEKDGGDEEGEVDRGVLHLEAQLAYRQGSYQEAFDLYNQLLDSAEPVRIDLLIFHFVFARGSLDVVFVYWRGNNSEEHSDILTNLEAAQKHLDFLTSGFLHALDTLPTAVSSTLQTAPPPQQQQVQAASVSALASASAVPAETQKARQVRMKRVPKGVVPGVTPPPDSERWLKKSERTTFAQGRRRKGGGGATQGAMEPASGKSTGGGKGKKKK
ncbi:hypothetical protein C8Q74DRAFT_1364160 [Fomes fomentarius]|nr:hypothetical protein C8Q74DRAFT_1364160 [Fomes fomentarius]